jgi:hypothetical protein
MSCPSKSGKRRPGNATDATGKQTAIFGEKAATASNRPVLLLYDTQAGHSGGQPQSKIEEQVSLELPFLLNYGQ